ncbi:reductase-related protein [Elysia marginata]|uniref:Reductase-related protein n=1 Tax=Elysia marginata TaxID=1093978 RepID=A0AAV4HKQ0_9GAST|nr:reductase-related protein [Elysia marginata]
MRCNARAERSTKSIVASAEAPDAEYKVKLAPIVLVTDGTNYTNAHIVKQLQDEGHQVRATVASLSQEEEKVKALSELCPEAKFKVEVVEVDPAKPETWEQAMKDVQYLIYTIKPEAAKAAAAEGEAPTQPAVEAIQAAFKAGVESKTVKRILLTSSYQAITAAPTAPSDKVFTEADWTDAETAEPLIKSLVLAEKAAWDFVKELPDADKIDLVVMNPTLALGPPLLDAQQDVVKMLLDRSIQGCPRVCYSVVDVRDVAAAYVKALTLDNVAGNRHILHGGNLWMRDIALALSKEFKPQGYNIHTMALPNVALWGLSLINKNAKTLMPVVGKQSQFDNTRMKDVLGITPKDVKETVVEEAAALVERGLVKKPKRARSATTNNQGAAAAATEGEEKKEGGDAPAEGEEKKEEEGAKAADDSAAAKDGEDKKEESKEEAKAGDEAANGEAEKPEEKKEEEAKDASASEEKKEEEAASTEAPKAE